MKQVGIAELRKELLEVLNDLPVEVTRRGKVVAVITRPGESSLDISNWEQARW